MYENRYGSVERERVLEMDMDNENNLQPVEIIFRKHKVPESIGTVSTIDEGNEFSYNYDMSMEEEHLYQRALRAFHKAQKKGEQNVELTEAELRTWQKMTVLEAQRRRKEEERLRMRMGQESRDNDSGEKKVVVPVAALSGPGIVTSTGFTPLGAYSTPLLRMGSPSTRSQSPPKPRRGSTSEPIQPQLRLPGSYGEPLSPTSNANPNVARLISPFQSETPLSSSARLSSYVSHRADIVSGFAKKDFPRTSSHPPSLTPGILPAGSGVNKDDPLFSYEKDDGISIGVNLGGNDSTSSLYSGPTIEKRRARRG